MTTHGKYPRLKNILRITGRVFIIISITLLLLEVVLGLVFKLKDRNLIDAEVSDYPYLYFSLVPQQGQRNSDGFKTGITREKPDNVVRIAITGGSVAYGNESENTIAAQLETLLNQSPGETHFEVMNAGVPAYVVEQEFIMIQLVLQYYHPDIIVSLSGYNDLISADINRGNGGSQWLAPHNWGDFRCIETNSRKRSVESRFLGVCPNIGRLIDFVLRSTASNKISYEQLVQQSSVIAGVYAQRVVDIHDFCQAKGIVYIHCLQPVNWELHHSDNPERNRALQHIYSAIRSDIDTCGYCFDFSDSFVDSPTIFTDECHVTTEGNTILSKNIALLINKNLNVDTFSNEY
ncbi:MAG TPA: hypothetical protein PLZ52_09630 [Bacteroidales bacterium]|nr:hypothetical protein [Bacteroidales bacterium]